MTLAAGSVAISALDGSGGTTSRTGSGLALAMFDALVIAKAAQTTPVPPPAPTLHSTTAPYSAGRPATTVDIANANHGRLLYFQDLAGTCNGIASLIPYIVANAVVSTGTLAAHVTIQQLGRTPSPVDPSGDEPILSPVLPVDIPLTGAGSLS